MRNVIESHIEAAPTVGRWISSSSRLLRGSQGMDSGASLGVKRKSVPTSTACQPEWLSTDYFIPWNHE